MYGAIDFYKACKKEGIKPIIGCEVYVAPRSRFDKEPNIDNKYNHLILLAKNNEGYKNLMEAFSFTQEQISEKVGKSRSAIANALRLNNLCDEIKSLVIEKKLSQGHARTILPVTDIKLQVQIADKIIKEDLSVRQTEKLVSDLLNSKPKKDEKN